MTLLAVQVMSTMLWGHETSGANRAWFCCLKRNIMQPQHDPAMVPFALQNGLWLETHPAAVACRTRHH